MSSKKSKNIKILTDSCCSVLEKHGFVLKKSHQSSMLYEHEASAYLFNFQPGDLLTLKLSNCDRNFNLRLSTSDFFKCKSYLVEEKFDNLKASPRIEEYHRGAVVIRYVYTNIDHYTMQLGVGLSSLGQYYLLSMEDGYMSETCRYTEVSSKMAQAFLVEGGLPADALECSQRGEA